MIGDLHTRAERQAEIIREGQERDNRAILVAAVFALMVHTLLGALVIESHFFCAENNVTVRRELPDESR